MILREAQDAHFAWILGDCDAIDDLALPEGGVDGPDVIALLRGVAATVREGYGCGMWLIVHEREVAGLCGYMAPPREGAVEIGYGIAAVWRRRGLATRAVAAMVTHAAQDAAMNMILAETAVANVESQLVLRRNGFVETGARHDPEDGDLVQWRLDLPRRDSGL